MGQAILSILSGALGALIAMVLGLGLLYWFWLSIQIGSFFMFVVGAFPVTAALIAAPVGAWSLVFGVPAWVANFFS